MSPGPNLAYEFARSQQIPVWQMREDYDGACLEFCDAFMHWLDDRGINHLLLWLEGDWDLCPETVPLAGWRYHTVLMVGGLVHDLWYPRPARLRRYLQGMFTDQAVLVERREADTEEIDYLSRRERREGEG